MNNEAITEDAISWYELSQAIVEETASIKAMGIQHDFDPTDPGTYYGCLCLDRERLEQSFSKPLLKRLRGAQSQADILTIMRSVT